MARETAPRIGIDTGGTFTDVVCLQGGSRRTAKVPSTPDDPARAVRAGLGAVGGLPVGGHLHHGTTVGTNAVLTRTGARVALVATRGFEDLLHLDRGQRSDLHALGPSRPQPLADRASCLGVDERTGAGGDVVQPLSDEALDRVAADVEALRPDAVAVCLLNALARRGHERRLVAALRRRLKGRGITVHASAELSADGREAERAATAVLDAYVADAVGDYIARLARGLRGRTLTVMRSDGGRMSAADVRRAPVRTLLSGPAAGVAAAHVLAQRLDLDRALSFDVGGTSTDVAWLEGPDLDVRGELVVGAYRASVPSLGLETVGAGGGSEIWLDGGGALRVGPSSAGADPGPACYGRGGPLTLTDAWLLLDRLPEALLDGGFSLSRSASHDAALPLARAAGCSVARLAEGAVRVAAATTTRALRRTSVAQGRDPRGAALVAFGGAGPMLAAETADLLGLTTVVIPGEPGAFAAEGALSAPLRADESRAVVRATAAGLRRTASTLARAVRGRLERAGARRVRLRREVDVRYRGQAFEVTVALDTGWQEAFHGLHARRFGFADPARDVEVVRVRVRGSGWDGGSPRRRSGVSAEPHDAPGARVGKRIRSVARADLAPGARVTGPSRVVEMTGTTFVPPGWRATVMSCTSLRLERVR